jgi:uncharacterized UPF0146 family protein
MLPDTYDIVEAIAKLYSGRGAIVEIGAGFNPWIAYNIKKRIPFARVIIVDKDQRALDYIRSVCPDLEVKLDDVTKMKIDNYDGVEIVYSIRPPPELIPYVEILARRISALLLIRPLTEGESGYTFDERKWMKIHPHLYILKI